MKISKKVICIISVNFILLFISFFLFEFIAYKKALAIFHEQLNDYTREVAFSYSSKLPNYMNDLQTFFNGGDMVWGRLPDGLEYNEKPPIVIFGCSFAYGFNLNPDQTFSYKLAQLSKRPVYNRAANAWGAQHMYYQTLNDSFYEDTQNADTYIYVMIENHLSRAKIDRFYIVDEYVYLHYNLKNDKFIMDSYENKLLNVVRSLYTRRFLNHYNAIKYKNGNQKELKEVNNTIYKYIKASKDNIENKLGKKINFVVIYFEKNSWVIPGKEILTEKLRKDGIQVFSIKELTNENLDLEKYNMIENGHPKEETWDLLTPLIAEKIGLTN